MKFDEVYKSMVDDLQPSSELVDKLRINEEARFMKFNKKKIAVVAAVACMAFGTTVFAAGHIASYRSWSNPHNEIRNYSDAVTKADELGSGLTIPESFDNGYTFDSANTMGTQGLDADGKVMVNGTDFNICYVKNGMPDINMFINQIYEQSDESYAIESKMIGDVEVFLNQATYKFVPEGYEFTEEDNKNIDDPHYEISYGSDQVEVKKYNGISFAKDGKYYSMFAWDSDMTVEDWYEMAEELLNN